MKNVIEILQMNIAGCEVSDDTERIAEIEKAIKILEKYGDEKLTAKVCKLLDIWFNEQDVTRSIMEITSVGAAEKENKIIITITLCRPGLFIGKSGKSIDALTLYLNKFFDKEIKFKIEEEKMWNNTFGKLNYTT